MIRPELRRGTLSIVAIAVAAFCSQANAATSVLVSSAGALQQALNTVPDGGAIELAGGTYNAPSGGWTIFPQASPDRSFTVRAAAGARVVLDGGRTTKILTVISSKPIAFENLTFANGLSTQQFYAGGVSIARTEVSFLSCNFENNAANSNGTGGAGVWIDTSTVSFDSCVFKNNTTPNFGGGMSAYHSRVFVRNCEFSSNRSNVPGHIAFSTGGAIHAEVGTMEIHNSRFEGNQAGYVGGAIYVIAPWQDPVSTPQMDLLVADCLFTNNAAVKNASSAASSAPATGGAIMMENQTRARIYNSRFVGNSAKQGGALSSYRTITEVQNSVFQDNQATGNSGEEGYGGSIIVLSDDGRDASTNNGATNRPSAQFTVTDSLFRGSKQSSANARQGGGIFVAGDMHANFGVGVQKNGTPDTNRTQATLKRVAFVDLTTSDSGNGTGGALTGEFANVVIEDSIFSNCQTSQNGGALDFAFLSVATVRNSTFSGNQAGSLGGAIASFGGDVNVDSCNLFDNTTVADGGYGSAITTVDGQAMTGAGIPAVDVTGTIQNSLFSANNGLFAIYDGHNPGRLVNRVQYNDNRFFEAGKPFYTDDGGDKSVAELNALTTVGNVKSTGGNTPLRAAPSAGAILMLPPRVLQSGAPGESLPLASQLVYVSTGGGQAIDGDAQRLASGTDQTTVDGIHTLTLDDGSTYNTAPVSSAALNISTRLAVGHNDDALIGGFFVVGSSPKRVIIRALGPSVPVDGALQDPTLQLVDGSGATLASNDNWRSSVIGGVITSSQAIDIAATGVPPRNDSESAIVATLAPGAYTAVVRGANNTSGVGLVEVFDLDAVQTSSLANISTRGSVHTGDDVMIGGFIYAGGASGSKVVVRAIGPSLAAAGVANPLQNPTLDLLDGNGNVVASNDDWQQSNQVRTITATGLQPTAPEESAVYLSGLPTGAYTAIVRGKDGGTGVGLVEAYIFD